MVLSLVAFAAQPSLPGPLPLGPLPIGPIMGFPRPAVSPLMIADRLLTLAQDADRAGFAETAADLVDLVYSVLEPRH